MKWLLYHDLLAFLARLDGQPDVARIQNQLARIPAIFLALATRAINIILAPYHDLLLQNEERAILPLAREAKFWANKLTGQANKAVKVGWTRIAAEYEARLAFLALRRSMLPLPWNK